MFVDALISILGSPFITGLSKDRSLFPSNEAEINSRVSGLSPLTYNVIQEHWHYVVRAGMVGFQGFESQQDYSLAFT